MNVLHRLQEPNANNQLSANLIAVCDWHYRNCAQQVHVANYYIEHRLNTVATHPANTEVVNLVTVNMHVSSLGPQDTADASQISFVAVGNSLHLFLNVIVATIQRLTHRRGDQDPRLPLMTEAIIDAFEDAHSALFALRQSV